VQALWRIYRDDPETPAWIDAACIDQLNIPERNEQVRMMQDIYHSAKKVQIFLGEPDLGSDEAMKYLGRHLILILGARAGSVLDHCHSVQDSVDKNGV